MSEFDHDTVSKLLAEDRYAKGLDIELVEVTADEITVAMTVTDEHANFLGVGHGGMVFSLADCAFSLASNSRGVPAVAIDAHLVLTKAVHPGDRIVARVRELSRGRTLGTYRAEVTKGDNEVAALFTGTVYINQG